MVHHNSHFSTLRRYEARNNRQQSERCASRGTEALLNRRGENGRKERRDAPDANAVPKENSSANSQCQLCERFFMSRNAVFRHLDACDKNPLNSYKEDSSSTIANHDNVPILTSSSCVKHEKKRKREEKQFHIQTRMFGSVISKEHATMKGLLNSFGI